MENGQTCPFCRNNQSILDAFALRHVQKMTAQSAPNWYNAVMSDSLPDTAFSSPAPQVWPPPPINPEGPVTEFTVEGIVCQRTGNRLTINNTVGYKNQVTIFWIMFTAAIFQIALISSVALIGEGWPPRLYSNGHLSYFLLPIVVAIVGAGMNMLSARSQLRRAQMRSHLIFDREKGTFTSGEELSKPLGSVKCLQLHRGSALTAKYVTITLQSDIDREKLPLWGRILPSVFAGSERSLIAHMKKQESAVRLAEEIADAAGIEIRRNW